jgi:hypothetical protein
VANALYAAFREALLAGTVSLTADDIRVLMVDASSYAPDFASDRSLAHITPGARLGASPTLTGCSVSDSIFDADDTLITGLGSATSRALVLYRHGASEATSTLIAYVHTGITGLTNTPAVNVRWNAAGILDLSFVTALNITVGSGTRARSAFGAALVGSAKFITATSVATRTAFGTHTLSISYPSTTRPALGMNIGGVSYFDDQIVFLDLIKQSPDWGLNNGGIDPPLDANGWPLSLPGGGAGVSFKVPAGGGAYVLLYEGTGTVQFFNGTVTSTAAGRIGVTLSGGENSMTITSTGAGSAYMRNLRLVPLLNESNYANPSTGIFNETFRNRCGEFGCLRFMDFQQTNASPVTTWASRPQPTWFSQMQPGGSSLEYAIDLCNQVQADCWICIPHRATDDYILGAANLCRDRLSPNLRLYVEYSNEIWNFSHGDEVQEMGVAYGIANGIPSQYPDEWDTRLRYQALRSKQIFDVFAAQMGLARIRRVLAGQMWDIRIEILVDHQINGVPAYTYCDYISIAPYVGGFWPFYDTSGTFEGNQSYVNLFAPYPTVYDAFTASTVAEIVQYVVADIPLQENILADIRDIATTRGKKLICYEAGQHLASNGEQHGDLALQQKLDAAVRHSSMEACYSQYMQMVRQYSDQIVMFKLCEGFSVWGRFGHLETINQTPDPPRWLAMLSFNAANPVWWEDLSDDIVLQSFSGQARFGLPILGSPGQITPPSISATSGIGPVIVDDGTLTLGGNIAPECAGIANYSEDPERLTWIRDQQYVGIPEYGYNVFDTFEFGNPQAQSWFGLHSPTARVWGRLEWQTGGDWYTAGGYFTSGLVVEHSSDGVSWTAATGLVITAIDAFEGNDIGGGYPYSVAALPHLHYRFEFDATPAREYIRIRGATATVEGFIAVSELMAFEAGSGGGGAGNIVAPSTVAHTGFGTPSIGQPGLITPNSITARSAFGATTVNDGSGFGTPISSASWMQSGHSLLEDPMSSYMRLLAQNLGFSAQYQQHCRIGSTITFRTLGNGSDPYSTGSYNGYQNGDNRDGVQNMDILQELRQPSTITGLYNTLIIGERHDSLGSLRWENTLYSLRHYAETFHAANVNGRVYFYDTWQYINAGSSLTQARVNQWITFTRAQLQCWECIASRQNYELQQQGRSDRYSTLPAGGALARLVELATAGSVAGISGTLSQIILTIFDNEPELVHLTPLGHYFIACVMYASVYKRSPVGATYMPSGVNATQRASLQQVAWDYVRTYYAANPLGPQPNLATRMSFIQGFCSTYWTFMGNTDAISGDQFHFAQTVASNPFYQGVPSWWPLLP